MNIRKACALTLAAGLALVTAACGEGPGDPTNIERVEWTSSFGFCPPTAYCTTRLSVSGSDAVLTLESREAPAKTTTVRLEDAEADALIRAAGRARFDGLAPVIGCPDCADGGAETLSVTTGRGQHTVTFEFNAPVNELEPLLGQVRGLAARLRPAP